jgi:phosphoribosylformylglycinamidine (FGAM) synthase PurS component
MKRKIKVHGVKEVKDVKGVKCYKFDLQFVS